MNMFLSLMALSVSTLSDRMFDNMTTPFMRKRTCSSNWFGVKKCTRSVTCKIY